MDPVARACILFGVLIVVTRGPLIFAPEATLRTYRRMLGSERGVRVTGAVLAALGVVMVSAGFGHPDLLARLVLLLGLVVGIFAAGMLLLPAALRSFFGRVFDFFEESIDAMAMRVAGAIAVAAGAGLIWLGVTR